MHWTRLASSVSLRAVSRGGLVACVLLLGSLAVATEPTATPDSISIDRAAEPRARHLAGLGVDRWHAQGIRGRGMKVAVLDSGFRGYRDYLGKTLPARLRVKSFRRDANLEARDSTHGILCAEVIHTLAPEADLLLANWEPDDSEAFLRAVAWAREQGARVISCSVIEPSWSDGEGGGPVHEALSKLLGDDLLLFASAGNTARRHWGGTFHDSGRGFHEWTPGHADNLLTPWGTERVSVEVCSPTGGYEVFVYDAANGAEIAHSAALAGHSAAARFQPLSGHQYNVRLRRTSTSAGAFHCIALGSALEFSTTGGSVCFPADGSEVIAVGAVDSDGHRMDYSSCGPNSKQPKPDLVASVPFPITSRPRPFGGTSAAAPQAAGLAALVWSSHAGWSAGQVRLALRDSARHLARQACDYETGYGLVRLPLTSLANRNSGE